MSGENRIEPRSQSRSHAVTVPLGLGSMGPAATKPRLHVPIFQAALAIALASGAALGHVYLHLQVLDTGYRISSETKLHHDLGDQNLKLQLELDTRRSLDGVERRAREELHMQPPDPLSVRVLHGIHSPSLGDEPMPDTMLQRSNADPGRGER